MNNYMEELLLTCIKKHGSDVLLEVEVKPGVKKGSIEGVDKWKQCLIIKVKAQAEKGKANKELIQQLSKVLCIPSLKITIIRGDKSRRKVIRIADITCEDVIDGIERSINLRTAKNQE